MHYFKYALDYIFRLKAYCKNPITAVWEQFTIFCSFHFIKDTIWMNTDWLIILSPRTWLMLVLNMIGKATIRYQLIFRVVLVLCSSASLTLYEIHVAHWNSVAVTVSDNHVFQYGIINILLLFYYLNFV